MPIWTERSVFSQAPSWDSWHVALVLDMWLFFKKPACDGSSQQGILAPLCPTGIQAGCDSSAPRPSVLYRSTELDLLDAGDFGFSPSVEISKIQLKPEK